MASARMQGMGMAQTNRVILFRPALLARSETFIAEQARSMQRWQPVLVGERLVRDGLPLDGLDVRLVPDPGSSALGRFAYRQCRRLGLAHPATVRLLRGIGARLFHAHFGTSVVDAWPLAKALGLPVVVTLHGYDINIAPAWWQDGQGGDRRRTYPESLRHLARAPQVHFIAVSETIRCRAIEYGIPPQKIRVCYTGVDAGKFQPGGMPIGERRKRVLFVGRLVEKKGVTHLIRAFATVRGQVPDAELVIVGDGPLRAELELLAVACNVPAEFHGALSSDLVKQQMDLARVFCLPSITTASGDAEGFGMVLLEAQACGVPAVTSARGGAAEGIIDGQTGYSFAERDETALAERLVFLLGEDQVLGRLSAAAIDFVTHSFSLRKCTGKLEAFYDDCVAPTAPSNTRHAP